MVECDVLGCGKEADPGYGVAFQNRCRGHSGKPSDLCAQQLVALRGALRDAMAFVDPATARDFHLWKDLLDVYSESRIAMEERQAHILAIVRDLRKNGAPEPALAPIIRYACVDMWSEDA